MRSDVNKILKKRESALLEKFLYDFLNFFFILLYILK